MPDTRQPGDYKVAYGVTTWWGFPDAEETWDSLPSGSRRMLIENSIGDWPLCRTWNYFVQRLCVEEGFEAVVIMNDDVVLREDTGQQLAHALLTAQYEDERQHPDRKIELVSAYNTASLPDIGQRWGLGPDFSCFCVSAELFTTMGKFDEKIVLFHEDNDAHYRLQLAGFEALSYSPYYHHGSQTLKRHDGAYAAAIAQKFDASRNYYALKWGGEPHHEAYTVPFNGRNLAMSAVR